MRQHITIATAAPRTARSDGFTLIEMMVVLLIAGILAAAATVTMTRNPHTDLKEDAQRLALLFETASDEAQLRDHPLAWEPDANGWHFVERLRGPAGDTWVPLADNLFAPQAWKDAVSGVAIHFAGSSQAAARVLFGVESISAPVVVTLYSDAGAVQIDGSGNGRYTVR